VIPLPLLWRVLTCFQPILWGSRTVEKESFSLDSFPARHGISNILNPWPLSQWHLKWAPWPVSGWLASRADGISADCALPLESERELGDSLDIACHQFWPTSNSNSFLTFKKLSTHWNPLCQPHKHTQKSCHRQRNAAHWNRRVSGPGPPWASCAVHCAATWWHGRCFRWC